MVVEHGAFDRAQIAEFALHFNVRLSHCFQVEDASSEQGFTGELNEYLDQPAWKSSAFNGSLFSAKRVRVDFRRKLIHLVQ